MKSDLFYELTSPAYQGEAKRTVYLDFIDYSNLDYYTTVKKRGGFAIPLLLYIYETNRFNVRLGEGSLTQTYREFLTEALLTECNTPYFILKPSPVRPVRKNARRMPRELLGDSIPTALPDSALSLKVKILHNETIRSLFCDSTDSSGFEGLPFSKDNLCVGMSLTLVFTREV